MVSICGIDCEKCTFRTSCRGCEQTCGKPFGGDCVAAEYIKVGGRKAYIAFKVKLLQEINEWLLRSGLPQATEPVELSGAYVNLEYPLPNGERAKFLDERKIYLGCQIEQEGLERCIGVVADTTFILVASYGKNGSNPELILYKHR